jgi:hypothetical protein
MKNVRGVGIDVKILMKKKYAQDAKQTCLVMEKLGVSFN